MPDNKPLKVLAFDEAPFGLTRLAQEALLSDGLSPTLGGGHNTSERYYRGLMYLGLPTSDTLRKKPYRIGSDLCRTSENRTTLGN